MKINFKFQYLLLLGAIFMSLLNCGGSDDSGTPPEPPANTAPTTVSSLTFPSADLLCIDNNITFTWTASTDADGDAVSYRIIIATDRALTNVVENRTTNTNSITLNLQRGVAYYWAVTAMDAEDSANASATQAFYTKGDGEANSLPFTAAIGTPAMGASVTAGNVSLTWTGGDADTGDTLTYDVFVGASSTSLNSVASGISASTFDQAVSSGETVFWRVDTSDNSGAKSIGQVWSFTVN